MIFWWLALALVILLVWLIVAHKNTKREKKIEFLEKCHKEGIWKLTTEKEIQKATLIAESLKLDSSDIKKLFEEARNLSQKAAEANAKSALEDKRKEERDLYYSLIQYSSYHGREKRIAMLTDAREQALKAAKDAIETNRMLMRMVTKSESNWAVAGGMVSGVAGPIAGALTAIDTEAKNIQIRAQNQENLKAMAPILYSFSDNAESHGAQAKRIAEMIENTKTKLVDKTSSTDCLKHLRFSDVEITVSKTGTCFVKAKASAPNNIFIFGDVKAVVDGTITASIYDKDKMLGNATMVLPAMGIPGKSSVELKGVCLFCGGNIQDKSYNIKFSADNLWLMEQ